MNWDLGGGCTELYDKPVFGVLDVLVCGEVERSCWTQPNNLGALGSVTIRSMHFGSVNKLMLQLHVMTERDHDSEVSHVRVCFCVSFSASSGKLPLFCSSVRY